MSSFSGIKYDCWHRWQVTSPRIQLMPYLVAKNKGVGAGSHILRKLIIHGPGRRVMIFQWIAVYPWMMPNLDCVILLSRIKYPEHRNDMFTFIWFFVFHSTGIQCPDPGVPNNGRRILDDFRAGMLVFFICNDGYQINGEQLLQCFENGTWNSDTPTCELIDSKFLHCTPVL